MTDTCLGFWSFEPRNGTVTCDLAAAAVWGADGPCTCPLVQFLGKIEPAGRRRILRAGLRSLRTAGVFDIVASVQTPRGSSRFRLIGGRGYRPGCVGRELHGVIEELPAGVRHSY
jgi:hypothetical protein